MKLSKKEKCSTAIVVWRMDALQKGRDLFGKDRHKGIRIIIVEKVKLEKK